MQKMPKRQGRVLVNSKNISRPGVVLLFSLMMLAVIVLLVQQLMRGVFVGSQFSRTMIERENAELLALSGINIAIAQLAKETKEEKERAKEKNTMLTATQREALEKMTPEQVFLDRVLPHLNRWQEFLLQEKVDGINGTIRVCITAEEGKININEAFDFKKMAFKENYQKILKGLTIPGKLATGEILTALTEYFKQRKKKLDDVSELLDVFGKYGLDIFYKPPSLDPGPKKQYQPNSDLMVQDIFTIWTLDNTINPVLFSDAMCHIFDLRCPLANDSVTRKEKFKQFAQNFKKEMASDWVANWKQLELLYDKTPKILPAIKDLFSKEFGPKAFSVLSCGKVGNVEQRVLVVIREQNRPEEDAGLAKDQKEKKEEEEAAKLTPEEGKDKDKKQQASKKIFKILRMYWL